MLAVTYGLLVQAFAGNGAGNAICVVPGRASGCHTISAQQARATTLQAYAAVLREFLSRSALALSSRAAIRRCCSAALSSWCFASRRLMSHSRITQPRVQQNTSIMDRLKIIGMR